jgi:hypothetical protein
VADPRFFAQRAHIADLAAHRVPAMYGLKDHAEVGGLMGYAADFTDLYRRAAAYVDKILQGARPADLPVEQPTRFELVGNRRTAGALGLTIAPSLLARGSGDRMIANDGRNWWAGTGLNRRHQDFQSCALPTELPARQAA